MGRQIQLVYSSGQVTITLPDGNTWKLILGTNNTLTQIFDPMHTGATPWRTFSYQNDHLGVLRLLTSIKDDANQELEGHTYEAATDRGLTSFQAGGTKSNVSIVYDDSSNPPTRTVTTTIDATTSETTTYTLAYLSGRWLPTQISGPCTSCGGSGSDLQIFVYDSSNHVTDKLEGSGAEQGETQYTYDGNGMMLTRKEAVGKPEQRTTTYSYNYASGTPGTPTGGPPWPNFVTSVTESSVAKAGQGKVTAYAWNSTGTPETTLASTISGYLKSTDTSPTVYTTTTLFDSHHRQTETDGPAASQKSTFSYYADTDATLDRRGRLQQTALYTSATAHLDTQYDNYDIFGTARKSRRSQWRRDRPCDRRRGSGHEHYVAARHGRPQRDGRLHDHVHVRHPGPAHESDAATRKPAPVRIRRRNEPPDRHDSGGRLREPAGAAAPDAEHHRRQVCRAGAELQCPRRLLRRLDDPEKRHLQLRHAQSALLRYPSRRHAPELHVRLPANLLTVQDERHTAANTLYAYDFLNRLKTVAQTQVLTPGPDVVTQYAYDLQDNLTAVTDPNSNVTTYAYDDFRRMQWQTCPVTGERPTRTTRRGTCLDHRRQRRDHDPRLRRSQPRNEPHLDATRQTTETVTYTYDDPTTGNYGKGRIATMTDPSGSATYAYERRGLLRTETKTILGEASTPPATATTRTAIAAA